MDGVIILNQYDVVTKTAFSWRHYFCIGVIIGAIIGVVFAVIFALAESDFLALLISLPVFVITAALFLGSMTGCLLPEPIEYETHYEVLINDDVSMNKFNDKYEVIEQRGKI